MPRSKKKLHEVESREKEILTSKVNPSGQGEDPAVKAMLSDSFVQGTNEDALSIALAMQQLLKGNASILENQKKYAEELNKIKQKMAEMDLTAQRWESDRERWLNEINAAADKLRVSGSELEKIQAKASLQMEQKVNEAKAAAIVDKQQFDEFLRKEPMETVISPGIPVMINVQGTMQAQLMDEEVRIKHRRWVLPAGQAIEVPRIVAQVLRDRRKSAAETQERQIAMKKNMEYSELDAKLKDIDKKYKSSSAHLGDSPN